MLESIEYYVCQAGEEEEPSGPGVGVGSVTPVLLTEAHDPVLPSLRHADVVHHEHVDVNVVGAAAADLHVG